MSSVPSTMILTRDFSDLILKEKERKEDTPSQSISKASMIPSKSTASVLTLYRCLLQLHQLCRLVFIHTYLFWCILYLKWIKKRNIIQKKKAITTFYQTHLWIIVLTVNSTSESSKYSDNPADFQTLHDCSVSSSRNCLYYINKLRLQTTSWALKIKIQSHFIAC